MMIFVIVFVDSLILISTNESNALIIYKLGTISQTISRP